MCIYKAKKAECFCFDWKSLACNEKEPPGKHLREDGVFNYEGDLPGKLPNYLGDAYPSPFYKEDPPEDACSNPFYEKDLAGKLQIHLRMLILIHFMKEIYLESYRTTWIKNK